ncbi:MAG: hypothetical protein O7I42_26675 [Alphaproteobacteria bacterium]|nr:hypothetical protein [Alphaproteobacteria bacterium]
MNAPPHNPAGAMTLGSRGKAGSVQDKTAPTRLKRWFSSLFGRMPKGRRARTPDIDPRFDNKAIENLLIAMRQQRMETSDGSIQMVHFGVLPQAIGRRWAGYVERAMRLSEGVLLKRLDPDDFFTRYADIGFIVVFADTEDHAAPKRAEALSEDIQHRLLLDRELANLVPIREVIARIIDLLGEKTPPKILKLAKALDNNAKLKEKEVRKAGKEPAPAIPSEAVVKKKSAPKSGGDKTKKARPKAKATSKSDDKFKVLTAHPADGTQIALPDWMGKFSMAFQPMLHVKKRLVGIHAGFPVRTTPDGEKLVGEAAYPKGGVGELTTTIDLLLARHVLDELRLAVDTENKIQISTLATLNSLATSNELSKLIQELTKKESQQFIIEIGGVRPSTPTGQLSETIGKLRGKVRSANLLVRLQDTKFNPFADIGLNAIGCTVAAPELSKLSAEEVAEAMVKFVENAKTANLGTYFHGVDTSHLLDAATKAGVDFITGDAFEPAVTQPGTPRVL